MLDTDLIEVSNKMTRLCDENNLCYDFLFHDFPITLRITPDLNHLEQMSLVDEDGSDFVNGEILLIFSDEIQVQIKNDFILSEDLLNKIKNTGKKMHYIFLQEYFKRQKMNKSTTVHEFQNVLMEA